MQSFIVRRIIQRLSVGSNFRHKTVDTSSGIYIYGAGELGTLAIEYCEACGIKILGVLDQKKCGIVSGIVSDYLVCKPEDISVEMRAKAPVAVAVATLPYMPILKTLQSKGWENVLPFYSMTANPQVGHPLKNGWLVGQCSRQELEMVEAICARWADLTSLEHYEAFLAWHIDGTELTLIGQGVEPNKRYAIPPLLAAFSKRFGQMVDVGSHQGESIKRLLDEGITFSEYILFEPDGASLNQLKKNVDRYLPGHKHIKFFDHVLGNDNDLRAFQEGLGYCSQLWSESLSLKSVMPLDSMECSPDLLKIHTEGTELEVLLGAIGTIDRCKPIIAFSIYHNRDGFCKAIYESMQRINDYVWYFRLHSYQGTGAFVYGIPR